MIKLIMLPYAGSIFDAYGEWKCYSNDLLEIVSLDYDGKGLRAGYPEPEDWKGLIQSTVRQIIDLIETADDYILFGHSMGAKVAMDVYTMLCKEQRMLPRYVVFSGTKLFTETETNLLDMEPKAFEKYFVSMGRIDEVVLHDDELKEMVFEYLRNDIKLLNQFDERQDFQMKHCIPVILNGDEEGRSPAKAWESLLGVRPIYRVFEGGHFFIFERKQEVFSFLQDMIIDLAVQQFETSVKVG